MRTFEQTIIARPQQHETIIEEDRLALADPAYRQGRILTLLATFRLGRLVGCQDTRGYL